MILEINPIHEQFSNCIEDIFINLIKWKEEEYRFIFANSWSFNYIKPKYQGELLEKRVDIYKEEFKQLENALKTYNGLEVTWKNVNSSEETFEIVKSEIGNGRPVGIEIDTFWCNWNKGYKNYHIKHYCLVIGFTEKELICIDPYLSSEIQTFNLDEYNNCCSKVFTVSFGSFIEENDWKKFITKATLKAFQNEGRSSDFDNMRELANEIKVYKNIENEFSGYEDITFAPIVPRIIYIGYGRKNFSKILLYYYEKYAIEELKGFAKRFCESASKWSQINSMLLKSYMSGFSDEKLEKIYVNINEVANYEEQLAQDMLLFIKQYNC